MKDCLQSGIAFVFSLSLFRVLVLTAIPPQEVAPQLPKEKATVDSTLVDLFRQGLTVEEVTSKVKSLGIPFDCSAEGTKRLREAGVSENVLSRVIANLCPPPSLVRPSESVPESPDQSLQAEQLTRGQKRAIEDAKELEENTIVFYDEDGKPQKRLHITPGKLPASIMDYAKEKKCEEPRPIDENCVVCKNKEIICANVKKWEGKEAPKT